MAKRSKIPSMSSKKLIKLLEHAGAVFDREGRGDHVIYKRKTGEKLMKAPVLENKKASGLPLHRWDAL